MPIQPNGTYLRQMNALSGPDVWQQRAAQANPLISASEHDAEMNDVATAISGCLKANGTTVPSVNLPMDGKKHTGVANATANDEYVSLGQLKAGLTLDKLNITINSNDPGLSVNQDGAGPIAVFTSTGQPEGVKISSSTSAGNYSLKVTHGHDAVSDRGAFLAGHVSDPARQMALLADGKLIVGGTVQAKQTIIEGAAIEINALGSGDRSSYIDFHSQDAVDFSARIIRGPGANGNLTIENSGTGTVGISSGGNIALAGAQTAMVSLTNDATVACPNGHKAILQAGSRSIELTQANGLEIQSSDGNIAGYIKTDQESGSSNNLVLYASRTSGNAGITFRTNDGAETDQVQISNNGGHLIVHADIRANANAASDIGTSTVQFDNIYCVDLIESSDERLKNTIQDSPLGLNFIKALRPVSYKYNVAQNIRGKDEEGNEIYIPREGLRPHYGLIAQEVKTAIDAAGVDFGGWKLADKNDPDSKQMLSYTQFIAPLIQAVKELSAKVETLEAEVATLKGA